MKLVAVICLAATARAFVLPDADSFAQLPTESRPARPWTLDGDRSIFEASYKTAKDALDHAISAAHESVENAVDRLHPEYVEAWMESDEPPMEAENDLFSAEDDEADGGDCEDEEEEEEEARFSLFPRRRHRPGRGDGDHEHHHQSNKTILQLILESKYTTRLAALIAADEELVKVLNCTKTNYTVFAPTDRAFEKIPDDVPLPSKDVIRKILLYHVSPTFNPAPKILGAHTLPTLLQEEELGDRPQRLAVGLTFRGVTVNYFVRVIAPNIFAKNGVIHAVDNIISPPPPVLKIIDLFPGQFSTLALGLTKTGLLEHLEKATHKGSTFFAPSNIAFQKLGPRINAFLFSKHGQKCLTALLSYHVVHNQTLYSNEYYKPKIAADGQHHDGFYHIDLPTLLSDRSLGIDIIKHGFFTFLKINGFVRVTVPDGVAKDGVIHVVSDVLIPPKKLEDDGLVESEELTVDDLIERLEHVSELRGEL